MSRDILDLIDHPDAPDPTPPGPPGLHIPSVRLEVAVGALLALRRQFEAIGKALTQFMAAVEPAAVERRVRISHMHSEYRRRTRRRNRGRR